LLQVIPAKDDRHIVSDFAKMFYAGTDMRLKFPACHHLRVTSNFLGHEEQDEFTDRFAPVSGKTRTLSSSLASTPLPQVHPNLTVQFILVKSVFTFLN
jgi:hypothetical protein